MSKRLLVPVDGSDQSFESLEFAMNNYSQANLILLHVVDISQFMREHQQDASDPEAIRETAREYATTVLNEAEDRAADHSGSVEPKTGSGQASRVILEYAESHDVDQIIIGCCGQTFKSEVTLGEVAESVVRRANVPVTVVHDHSDSGV